MILFAVAAELRASKIDLEEGLIERIAQDDMEAFEQLYKVTD